MGWRCIKKKRLIKEFVKGLHSDNIELEEDYLDWFFLHHYHKSSSYWRQLSDEQINVMLTLTQQKEQEFWTNWTKMFKSMFGK